MKIRHWFPALVAILLTATASLSCDRLSGEPTATQSDLSPQSANVSQSEAPAAKSIQIDYQGKLHDPDRKRSLVGKIEFAVKDPAQAEDGPSPYVSIENPEKDIRFMDKADEIVVAKKSMLILIDYPVAEKWEFRIASTNPNGFTRAGLANEISRVYHAMYAEEARSTAIKVVPLEQRKGLINRNQTDGKYGIWGHDIGDLVLHTVELYQGVDGEFYAELGIDS